MALFQAGRELRAPRANRINVPRTSNGRLLGLVIITNNSIGGIGRFFRAKGAFAASKVTTCEGWANAPLTVAARIEATGPTLPYGRGSDSHLKVGRDFTISAVATLTRTTWPTSRTM